MRSSESVFFRKQIEELLLEMVVVPEFVDHDEAVIQYRYKSRTPNVIQRLFRERFPALEFAYEQRFAAACR
jgi:hypothetical protein